MTREEYFRFSLGRDPYGASEKPRPTGPVVIQGLSGPVEVGNPFNPMHLIRGVGDMFMGALQDMGNIGDTSFHSPPTKQQPSAIGDTIDTAKAIKDDPVGVGKALVDSMMPYSKGGFVNLGTAVVGPKVMPKVVSGAKTGAQAVKKGADSAIDWMKPTHGNIGRDMSRRELVKSSSSAALPILTKKGQGTFSSTKPPAKKGHPYQTKAQYELDIKDAVDEIKGGKMWDLYVSRRIGELEKRSDGMPEYLPEYKDIMKEHEALLDGMWEDRATGNTATQRHKNLEWATRDAGESGMFTKREMARMIHPLYVKAQKWLKKDKAVTQKASDAIDRRMKTWQAEEKARKWKFNRDARKMHHKGPIRLPITTRPIMPDHGRTINFMMPIE